MAEYRQSGHALCDIKYHLVWITKYRYKILRGEVAERARDLIRQICHAREVVIIGGSVSPDHIHMLVSAPGAFGSFQTGAVRERAVEPSLAGGISALTQALLGPVLVGTRILLRDSGGGR